MRRLITPALLAVTAMLALSGCVKLDAELEVHEDETVSGTMTLAMSKKAIAMVEEMTEGFGELGASLDEVTGEEGTEEPDGSGTADLDLPDDDLTKGMTEEMFPTEDLPEGAEVEAYEDDKFLGQTMTFTRISVGELGDLVAATSDEEAADSQPGKGWSLTREGDTYVFEGNADFSEEGAEEEADAMGMEGLFEDSELRIAVTFPGSVVDSNGEVDGNTVTWRPAFGETLEMRAEAAASEEFPVWPVVGAVSGVLLLAGLVLVAVRERRRRDGGAGTTSTLSADPHQPVS
ncbi:LppM family (lipo)protein [Nocardioides campestrisoli]|uniref:LppM family (lipo)protein n=1 Tax=Nocardioides campestrisoli TaxID=2736757 RepID=UPI0015E71995|nr:hypothetical protein [Nocardioides campestrisoli]